MRERFVLLQKQVARPVKRNGIDPLWLFVSLYLAAMFLPRLVPMGMFGDGLLYASMARNLAEGRGSMWAPFFSSGYFVEFASGNPYFENPPLMLWLQAGFFRLLGDPWWVEKLYALLLFVLNAWLIVRVWDTPLRGTLFHGRFGWLPLFFWYLIPVVIWGNPNNLMDNNLLTFCLLSLWCVLQGLSADERWWPRLTLAGLCVYLGFMTKGPVALYPIAAPFLLAAVTAAPSFHKRKIFEGLAQSAWVAVVAAGAFVLMLALVPESKFYFENYWERRLGAVIAGERADALLTGWARLKIFAILATELSVVVVVTLLVAVVFNKKRHERSSDEAHRKVRRTGLLFLLLGLAATLPLIASARQSGMYVIPSLPMFALAAGYVCLPAVGRWLEKPSAANTRFLGVIRVISWVGFVALSVHLAWIFGKPARERALLQDLPSIQRLIPEGEKVAVCTSLMNNLHTHTYLQRFHHLELSRDFSTCRFALTEPRCDAEMRETLRQNGFVSADTSTAPTQVHFIYLKKYTSRR